MGATRDIARAQVRYEDAATVRAGSQTQRVTARYAERAAEVVAAANHQVQAHYAANVLAKARDEVVALADAGCTREAGARMRVVSASLATLGAAFGTTKVSSMAAPAAAAADEAAAGLSNAERKAYRAEGRQIYSQQRVE